MHKNKPHRIVITTKDVMLILGKSNRTARRLMKQMCMYFKKKRGQYITVAEFCEFVGLTEEEVLKFF
ncbi:hypothetical protein EG028_25245 [Chitinophaga barathri]|uniref:Uncharacterized protein n=1 Tax=Chitinophaga barathri TaxID=1647451 RepID=A0A3N4M5X1_9BACT|nr:hypothetical protein EG028_25245 [Chitinophaga barathri]